MTKWFVNFTKQNFRWLKKLTGWYYWIKQDFQQNNNAACKSGVEQYYNFVINNAVCWPYVNNAFVALTVIFVNRNEVFRSVYKRKIANFGMIYVNSKIMISEIFFVPLFLTCVNTYVPKKKASQLK